MRNEIGNTYGRLTVIAFDHKRKSKIYYKCSCSCGCVTVAEAGALREGRTSSCGCLRRELGAKKHLTHGYADKERLYNIWIGIKQRCNNKNYRLYKWYGGKGVRLCKEWYDYPTSYFVNIRPSFSLTDVSGTDMKDADIMFCRKAIQNIGRRK